MIVHHLSYLHHQLHLKFLLSQILWYLTQDLTHHHQVLHKQIHVPRVVSKIQRRITYNHFFLYGFPSFLSSFIKEFRAEVIENWKDKQIIDFGLHTLKTSCKPSSTLKFSFTEVLNNFSLRFLVNASTSSLRI